MKDICHTESFVEWRKGKNMDKISITQEQKKAVEHKQENDGRGIEAILRDVFYEPNYTSVRSVNEVIREMGVENFIKVYYYMDCYEVEPELKLGAYIKFEDDYTPEPVFGKITEITDNTIRINNECSLYYHRCPASNVKITALTSEEIADEKRVRWWKKRYRKVWELRKGDLFVTPSGKVREVSYVEGNKVYTTFDDPVYSLELMKNNKDTRIVCFVEDRQDV